MVAIVLVVDTLVLMGNVNAQVASNIQVEAVEQLQTIVHQQFLQLQGVHVHLEQHQAELMVLANVQMVNLIHLLVAVLQHHSVQLLSLQTQLDHRHVSAKIQLL